MKKLTIKISLLSLLFTIALLGCKKGAPQIPDFVRPVKVEFKGVVLNDPMEFVVGGKVVGKAFETNFAMTSVYYNPNEKVQLRRVSDGKVFGEFDVKKEPFRQVKTIYFDGTTVTDRMELTPVVNQENIGVKLRFSSSFKDIYLGPVDVEIYDYVMDWDTFIATYTLVKKVSGITAAFGEFFELPPLVDPSHNYMYKVYKEGTMEPPFTDMTNVKFEVPEYEYGELVNGYAYVAGESYLLSLSPSLSMGDVEFVSGYSAIDFAAAFK